MSEHPSLAILTDLYELTMAYGYWKLGMADREAVFTMFYRTQPFGGGFAVAAGLEDVARCVEDFRFSASDVEYLRTLESSVGTPLFEEPFLEYLRELRLEVDLDMVPEGTAIFPHEPLVRVRGPLLHAQILETVLLNIVNFQTLIATKAARLRVAAPADQIIEFGLRRSQGIDGGVSAARAAYVGGCDSTSNVMAGRLFGIPVSGTHAHSWIMAFDSEAEAFESYAEVMGDNCILLVDTYASLEGVSHAVKVGLELKERGKHLLGVRLDSGDLLALSKAAREILDEAGLHETAVVASNELDEHAIRRLKEAGSPISVWGVGTRLATGHPDGALDGVYKLTAIRKVDGAWAYKAKRSSQPEKSSPPGILQVRRYRDASGSPVGDLVVGEELGDPAVPGHLAGREYEELLQPIFRKGKRLYDLPSLEAVRTYASAQLESLPEPFRRLEAPEAYFVGTERSLHQLKVDLLGLGSTT